MPGLLDIGPLSEDIPVGKKQLTVFGLTIEDIFYLVNNFAEVKALLERKLASITPDKLMESAPTTIASIIACATGERADKKAIAAAIRLSAGNQLKIINTIFRLTFPQGVGPFVEELVALQRSFTTPITEDSDTASQGQSLAALQMDELSEQRYRPHRAN